MATTYVLHGVNASTIKPVTCPASLRMGVGVTTEIPGGQKTTWVDVLGDKRHPVTIKAQSTVDKAGITHCSVAINTSVATLDSNLDEVASQPLSVVVAVNTPCVPYDEANLFTLLLTAVGTFFHLDGSTVNSEALTLLTRGVTNEMNI